MIDCSKTENYFAEKQRMTKRKKNGVCEIKCNDCPLSITNNGIDIPCSYFETIYTKKAILIVQRWSNTHPPKTYLTELLKIFPNTLLADSGMPKHLCPYHLGLMNRDDCRKYHDCAECWNQPLPEREEDEENDSNNT